MRCVVWLTALALGCASVEAGIVTTYEDLRTRSEEQIRFVTTCGSWTHEGERGFFRITEAYMWRQSYFYVQWMEAYSDNGSTGAIETVALINDDHVAIELSNIRCEERPEGARVVANTYSFHTEEHNCMILDLASKPGRYEEHHVSSDKCSPRPAAPSGKTDPKR